MRPISYGFRGKNVNVLKLISRSNPKRQPSQPRWERLSNPGDQQMPLSTCTSGASLRFWLVCFLLVTAGTCTSRVDESCGDDGAAPVDPCRVQMPVGAAWRLPSRDCWAARGAIETKSSSLTVLTRAPMQQIVFRGELLTTPPYTAPLSVNRNRLCDGSQSGGGACHYSVTRSVLRGLQLVDHNFTFNPPNASFHGEVIWALAGTGACAAAASSKRARPAGEVFIVAGPNTLDVAECGDVDIDLLVVPSQWVKDRVAKGRRVVSLYAGVDTDFWKPGTPWESRTRQRILLYDKSRVSDGSLSRC